MPKDTKNGTTPHINETESFAVDFVDYWQMPISPGSYQIKVTQSVGTQTGAPTEDFTSDTKTVVVLSDRFELSPDLVNSTFPPNGVVGQYYTSLPHIVFNRKTLPWERRIDGDILEMGPMSSDNMQSWLAVLVLDEEDDFPDGDFPVVQSGSLADLVSTSVPGGKLPENTYHPAFQPNPDLQENLQDPCAFIDLPQALFSQITPSTADLNWLAHGRVVSMENKTTPRFGGARKLASNSQFNLKDDLVQGSYSVVMANRFPRPGNRTHVHLVSLEKFSAVLKPGTVPTQYDTVRLVSLYDWSFQCFEEKDGFADRVMALNNGHTDMPWLIVPEMPGSPSPSPNVRNAITMGFTPFNHLTRTANISDSAVIPNKMVSWYRSPFVSFDIISVYESVESQLPFNSSDQISRYNPNTGMFDITYAAAWELGKLLGLQDKAYSSALYQFKRDTIRTSIDEFEQNILNEALAPLPVDPDNPDQPNSKMYRTLGGDISKRLSRFGRIIPKSKR